MRDDARSMTRRDRHLLFGIVGMSLALSALMQLGVHSDALLAIPALVFIIPLLSGRYLGEQQLARLAAVFQSRRRRPAVALLPTILRAGQSMPRGGCLIASSLAVRPPPAMPRFNP